MLSLGCSSSDSGPDVKYQVEAREDMGPAVFESGGHRVWTYQISYQKNVAPTMGASGALAILRRFGASFRCITERK